MKIKKKCDVCNKDIFVDEWGNGRCKNCSWEQNADCLNYPNVTNPPNFVSLNRAKVLFKNNKPLLPTYKEMLHLVERGFDISFIYKKQKYQLDLHQTYTLWKVGTQEYIEYKDFHDLSRNLSINKILLKDIWQDVKSLKYEC